MKIGVFCDLEEENWRSMDLVADMLLEYGAGRPGFELARVQPRLPRALSQRGPDARSRAAGRGALAFGRYLKYPLVAVAQRARFDWFHVADHSYAHLALCLPRGKIGVFCHDLDTFRPLFAPGPSAHWRTALARSALAGLKSAAVVFHSTPSVRDEILERRLVPQERLVSAPYGVGPEFVPEPSAVDATLLGRRPFLLHVGSLIPRKNPELLLELFARARKDMPELSLVQIGGTFGPRERSFVESRGLGSAVHSIAGFLERSVLAAYYRSALAVVLPSLAEGFGLPVVEALSCGAPVVASDIPVLRSVGGEAVVYCPLGEADAWRLALAGVARGEGPSRPTRLAVAARYSWRQHAATILDASAAAARGE